MIKKSSPEYYSDLIVRVFDRQFIYDNAIEVKSNLRWIARTRRDIKFNGRDQLAIFSYLKHPELPNIIVSMLVYWGIQSNVI